MELENKLLEEVARFNQINKYARKLMNEQELPPAPDAAPDEPGVEPPAGELPPAPEATAPEAPAAESDVEELDITDLVNMTKSIKNDMDDTKSEHQGVITKMDDVFTKLSDLEQKLANMDAVMAKIDELGNKIEQVKQPSPEERLQMRSLDSYPFNQNPQQFFAQKQGEMRASGKNEYILTKDEIQNYSQETIRDTFTPQDEEQDEFSF